MLPEPIKRASRRKKTDDNYISDESPAKKKKTADKVKFILS